MKWFDKWLYKKIRDMWDNRYKYEEEQTYSNQIVGAKMGTGIGAGLVERGRSEGEGRITFELSTAVGGKILNVRRYDERKDSHNTQTYVIPTGEDIGERVAKIINLEQFRN